MALHVDDIQLAKGETWDHHDIFEVFRTLRRERPVSFHADPELDVLPAGPGFWSVVKHADVMHVSRHPDLFISGKGTNIPDFPEFVNEFLGSIINMDAPRHTKLRGIVNRGFTPRMVARVESSVREVARRIVAELPSDAEFDFVDHVAARLPLQIICDMMGIPASDYRWILEETNRTLGGLDPEYGGTIEGAFKAAQELQQYGLRLAQQRLDEPGDDITSALMHADIDGERMSTAELGSFFVLLVVAGNETTRNAIGHGLLALTQHPEQRRVWLEDFETVSATAVEEIVRWSSPVIHFRRTSTADTFIRDTEIKAGDKVVMWYLSANRDEDVFAEPDRFDVRRTPNEHVGFGAGGPHFCLGAHLARREIKVLFEELFRAHPGIEACGPPELLRSPFIHGIKRMPARLG